jgi:hypothetical protein
LAADVYLPEVPDSLPPPPPLLHNVIHLYLFTQGRGGGVDEPMRRLEGR